MKPHASPHREGARGQRPLRLVHPVDVEVVDLVDGVARGVEDRRHERAPEDGQERGERHRVARAVGAPGGHGAAHHPEGGRQEREGAGEVDVGLDLVHRSRTIRVGDEGADRGVGRVQQVVVHPAAPLGHRAEDALGEAAEEARDRHEEGGGPAEEAGQDAGRAHGERAEEAAERALEADRALGARRHGPQRRDEEGAPAVGLAHLGRAGVGGGGRHRGRVGEGQQVAQARRGHPREHGQEGRDAAVGPGVPPAAGPALLLRDPARGLRAVAELRGRGAEDEERDHEGEAGQAEARGDRGPDDDRRDGARDVDRPREEGGHGDRRVHREADEGAPREERVAEEERRAPPRRRAAGRGPPRAGTVTLSSSVVGSDSTRAQARARAKATPSVRGQCAAPGSRGERADPGREEGRGGGRRRPRRRRSRPSPCARSTGGAGRPPPGRRARPSRRPRRGCPSRRRPSTGGPGRAGRGRARRAGRRGCPTG